jgi:hypothetical protein
LFRVFVAARFGWPRGHPLHPPGNDPANAPGKEGSLVDLAGPLLVRRWPRAPVPWTRNEGQGRQRQTLPVLVWRVRQFLHQGGVSQGAFVYYLFAAIVYHFLGRAFHYARQGAPRRRYHSHIDTRSPTSVSCDHSGGHWATEWGIRETLTRPHCPRVPPGNSVSGYPVGFHKGGPLAPLVDASRVTYHC